MLLKSQSTSSRAALIQPYLHKERHFGRNNSYSSLLSSKTNFISVARFLILPVWLSSGTSLTFQAPTWTAWGREIIGRNSEQNKHNKQSSDSQRAEHSLQMKHLSHLRPVSDFSKYEELFSCLRKRRIHYLLPIDPKPLYEENCGHIHYNLGMSDNIGKPTLWIVPFPTMK